MEEETDPENPGDLARENLRVIRELMERATIYRAVSAFPALAGGVLAVVVSLVLWIDPERAGKTTFVLLWLGVLIVVDGLNTWLLYRDSKRRGADFPSPQMIHGIIAMAPAMIVSGWVGLVFAWVHEEFVRCVLIWTMGYGLGLLATSSFAPGSIKRLGWAFLLAGFGFFLWHEFGLAGLPEDPMARSALIMGTTFGLLHLVYAIRTGLSSKGRA